LPWPRKKSYRQSPELTAMSLFPVVRSASPSRTRLIHLYLHRLVTLPPGVYKAR
jgi:hypothetical protein